MKSRKQKMNEFKQEDIAKAALTYIKSGFSVLPTRKNNSIIGIMEESTI